MQIRDAILNGVRAASEVHEKFGLRDKLKDGKNSVDIFEIISNYDVATICRPLDKLLGAYFRSPSAGIILTTNRRLPIQRFTAAHELGHHLLNHEVSFDSEDTISQARMRQGSSANTTYSSSLQEIEAESFAAELLFPKWLCHAIAKRQNWSKNSFKLPQNIYQLSLRAGISYEATWRMLLAEEWISKTDAHAIQNSAPKESKQEVLQGVETDDSWSEAFYITEFDKGTQILASPGDTLVIELVEHTNGGYEWEIPNLDGLQLISDNRDLTSSDKIGGSALRRFVMRGEGLVDLSMYEKRSWENSSDPISIFDIEVDFYGREEGLPRVARG